MKPYEFSGERLVTTAELARLLGLSEQGCYRLGRLGRLPVERVRLGRVVRYRAADVERILRGGGING